MQRDGSGVLGSAEGEALCPSESTLLCKAKYNVLYFTRGSCCADRPAEKYGGVVAIMGYAVLHMQKFKAGGIYGIQSHNNREHPPRTNPDIHPERTEQNYHVISCDNYASRIKQLITEQATATRTVRKDAVVYCSFIITSDHETMAAMGAERQKLFFAAAADWFAARYGSEHIVNATVHMDETTPHMHIGVVPVKDNRLSAKALFDKKELTALQTEFAKDVGVAYGLERGVEGSEHTHLSETRFKLETARKRLSEAEKAIETVLSTYEVKKTDIEAVEGLKTTKLPGGKVVVAADRLSELQDISKAYIANRDELEGAAAARAAAERARKSAARELAAAQQPRLELQAQLQDYRNEITQLRVQLRNLQEAHARELQDKDAKIKEWQDDYNFVLSMLNDTRETLKEYDGLPNKSEYEDLLSRMATLQQQLADATATAAQAEENRADVMQRLEKLNHSYETFVAAVKATMEELNPIMATEFRRRVDERFQGRDPHQSRRQDRYR